MGCYGEVKCSVLCEGKSTRFESKSCCLKKGGGLTPRDPGENGSMEAK